MPLQPHLCLRRHREPESVDPPQRLRLRARVPVRPAVLLRPLGNPGPRIAARSGVPFLRGR